jgi:predicted Fe-Mo cluster-binding NifX family protein
MFLEGLGVAFIVVSVGLNTIICCHYGPRVYAVLELPEGVRSRALNYNRTATDDVLDASI